MVILLLPLTADKREIKDFLKRAGINTSNSYLEAREVINRSAEQMRIDKSVLDYSIWKYMSGGKGRKFCPAAEGVCQESSVNLGSVKNLV